MFVHSEKLPHLLPPAAYFEPEWFDREMTSLFRPQWNVFCLATELAKDGDQFARELFGMPIVVINRGGTLYALKNVCAHRHSNLVSEGHHHQAGLKCQIHGWEYDETGRLTKITDGRCFKGFKATNLCLTSFRVERAGPVVMVSTNPKARPFREHMGAFAEEFERFFTGLRHIQTLTLDVDVNWKIIVENAVESYHVPMVHPTTFQDYRAEELHDHTLEPTYSRYGDLLPYAAEKNLESRGFRAYTRLLIKNPTFKRFTHVNLYPNLLLYFGDIFCAFNYLEPVGPEKTKSTILCFVPGDVKLGLVGRMIQDLSMVLFLRMSRKIVAEDVSRWPPVQRGIRQSQYSGILSCREERVYSFQKYVAEQLGHPMPDEEKPSAALAAGVPDSSAAAHIAATSAV